MAAKPCKCDMPVLHAKAVESAVFACLLNAQNEPANEDFWRHKADSLESKFTTAHGRHYATYTGVAP